MTDQELNERIAVKRGWKCFQQKRGIYDLQYIYSPNKYPWDGIKNKELCKAECIEIPLNEIDRGKIDGNARIPDFANDWKYAGELLDELIQKMNLTKIAIFLDEIVSFEPEIYRDRDDIITLTWHKSDNKCRKIAEAWDEVNP